MKRRDFFKNGSLAFLGTSLLSPFDTMASIVDSKKTKLPKTSFFLSAMV